MRRRRFPVFTAVTFALLLDLATQPLMASSHREAPGITEMPKVDSTDFYMFRSYESGRSDYITLIANYYPFQDPFGGPNYFFLDPDARYRIHIDNNGDGVEDLTFQFEMAVQLRDLTVPVDGDQVSVPLYNIGPIAENVDGRSPNLNILESYRLSVIRGRVTNAARERGRFATNPIFPNDRFPKPADNVGQKSIPDYDTYASNFVFDFEFPGCNVGDGRVFVGQRKESFAVNVGEIFDLVNLNPLGARDAEPNALEDKNVTTFALEVPIGCLTRNAESAVIGGWQTSALPNNRGLMNRPTFQRPANEGGAFVQVSRLGMPLVNEVIIGIKDKNLFNASSPAGDAALAIYITKPALPEILQLLFPVQAPNNFPRLDLVAAFATGIQGVNFLSDGRPHEMQRLNTSIPPTPAASQNNLGVLGGDNAGFPNGRRPGDDVTDIELRVAMGALCHALPGVFCNPSDAPSGTLPFTDGTLQDVSQFDNAFPYLRDPLPGSPNGPNGVDDDGAP
jgi:hypothetical protein